ncbi:hypothetical protein WICPIJ_001253, partial [Wickerhamomyces pijperi]
LKINFYYLRPSGTCISILRAADGQRKITQEMLAVVVRCWSGVEIINYSMSISLGVAGTASSEVMKKWVKSHSRYTELQYLEKQYRVSMYVGVGFAGIAVGLAFLLHLLSYVWEKQGLTADFREQLPIDHRLIQLKWGTL